MAKLKPEDATLILRRWLDDSTKLFVIEVAGDGFLLKASDGDVQMSVGLSAPDTKLWYWEPREFSSDAEFAGLLGALPDSDKYRSVIGISFSGKVSAPSFEDALVPLGKVVLMALWD